LIRKVLLMSLWLDHKYVGLLSNRLERFHRKTSDLYNCRCPLCGDSKKDLTKTRGYLIARKGSVMYYCHNCGASMGLGKFIQQVDNTLYDEYIREVLLDKNTNREVEHDVKPDITKIVWPKYLTDSPLKTLKKISQLRYDHPAKKYVDKRMIPTPYHAKLFFCPKFKQWVNGIVPDKFENVENDEPRLIIPFLDKQGNLFGFQGRSFKKNGIRYITIILNNDYPKVYGLDSCNLNEKVYIFEGPIDSMFIKNSLAMAGSDLSGSLSIEPNNVIMVYDNEPRNKEIVKKVERSIEKGYNVVIWPEHMEEKDCNDMVMAGMGLADLKLIIDCNTKRGMEAMLAFQMWKKC